MSSLVPLTAQLGNPTMPVELSAGDLQPGNGGVIADKTVDDSKPQLAAQASKLDKDENLFSYFKKDRNPDIDRSLGGGGGGPGNYSAVSETPIKFSSEPINLFTNPFRTRVGTTPVDELQQENGFNDPAVSEKSELDESFDDLFLAEPGSTPEDTRMQRQVFLKKIYDVKQTYRREFNDVLNNLTRGNSSSAFFSEDFTWEYDDYMRDQEEYNKNNEFSWDEFGYKGLNSSGLYLSQMLDLVKSGAISMAEFTSQMEYQIAVPVASAFAVIALSAVLNWLLSKTERELEFSQGTNKPKVRVTDKAKSNFFKKTLKAAKNFAKRQSRDVLAAITKRTRGRSPQVENATVTRKVLEQDRARDDEKRSDSEIIDSHLGNPRTRGYDTDSFEDKHDERGDTSDTTARVVKREGGRRLEQVPIPNHYDDDGESGGAGGGEFSTPRKTSRPKQDTVAARAPSGSPSNSVVGRLESTPPRKNLFEYYNDQGFSPSVPINSSQKASQRSYTGPIAARPSDDRAEYKLYLRMTKKQRDELTDDELLKYVQAGRNVRRERKERKRMEHQRYPDVSKGETPEERKKLQLQGEKFCESRTATECEAAPECAYGRRPKKSYRDFEDDVLQKKLSCFSRSRKYTQSAQPVDQYGDVVEYRDTGAEEPFESKLLPALRSDINRRYLTAHIGFGCVMRYIFAEKNDGERPDRHFGQAVSALFKSAKGDLEALEEDLQSVARFCSYEKLARKYEKMMTPNKKGQRALDKYSDADKKNVKSFMAKYRRSKEMSPETFLEDQRDSFETYFSQLA